MRSGNLLTVILSSIIFWNIFECHQLFNTYVRDKRFTNFYHEYVVLSRARCVYSCFTDDVCIAVSYHGSRQTCYLFGILPDCNNSTTDIGMITYMPPDTFVANIALNKPAVMSSVFKYSKACRAVDGDLSIRESHTLKNTLEWWCVDLEKIYNYTSIVIYNRNNGGQEFIDRIKGFELRLSYTGTCNLETYHGTTLCHKDAEPTALDAYKIMSCKEPSVSFSSRFIFVSPRSNTFLTMREMVVLGNVIV